MFVLMPPRCMQTVKGFVLPRYYIELHRQICASTMCLFLASNQLACVQTLNILISLLFYFYPFQFAKCFYEVTIFPFPHSQLLLIIKLFFLEKLNDMLYTRLFLLSALWRPHSEQIKYWIAASAKEAEVLSLARNYVHDLDLQNALVTFDDGLELVDILPKIRYPQGSHASSYLAKHIEATSNDLTAHHIKQLSANVRLAGDDLGHYEAALCSPSFFDAFSRCIHSLESTELVQLAFPFCNFVSQRGSQTKHVASRILLIIAAELTRRLNESNDKAASLTFLAAQNLPLDAEQWENLRSAAFTLTAVLDKASLQSLLQLIASHNATSPNSSWGSVIQETLVKSKSISNADVCDIVINVIRSGCPVDSSLIDQMVVSAHSRSGSEFLHVLTAWQEAKLRSCDREIFSSVAKNRFQACVEARLGQTLNPSFSDDSLLWVYCLSFFSAKKAAAFLKLWFTDAQKPPNVSDKNAALICKIMISSDDFFPVLLHSVCEHAKCPLFDQEESIAVLYVYQKTGKGAPRELVKKAVGRLGGRLAKPRSQESKEITKLSLNGLAILLAGLSFVDDEEQLTILKRLLHAQQLTPAVAMAVLRYTQSTKTKACQFTRSKIVKHLIKFAGTFSAEEVCFTMSVLAELQIRDAAAFEHLFRELQNKTPSIKNIVAAGKSAKALRLNCTFELLNVVPSLFELSEITPADLFTMLRCCRTERRRALLSCEKVQSIVNNVTIAEMKTPDLLILFCIYATNMKRRETIAQVMAMRDPVTRHEIDVDDVIEAFECAVSSQEIESICKISTTASRDLSELHLMRLLRCAQGYSSIPNKFYRFVGRAILLLSSDGRLSPNNALLWTKFYCDHQIKDDSVGRCLVMRAGRTKVSVPPDMYKTLQKAGMLYGVSMKSVKSLTKPQPKAIRRIIADNIIDKAM
ncbi:hypothetical protein ABL78_7370 [Leptomonas seymouri]|uniref:Uncharacterized protein n=1 Tax=Leptomonas seymouri TaxID=5684 RepID=A0A0N0P3F0_LEPSE|nr:hypothetical protein ABL78_7370 [Leptomonas seymouri]|eukprot:KPI83597.1 hypothetical protein ABL78_7370 [Leptomonas seymouri]